MKNSLKGALLSALIFPGIGHISLKRYRRGIVFFLSATISMGVIVVEAVRTALAILQKIEADGAQITMETIRQASHQAVASSGNVLLNAGIIFLLLCWLFAVVDAYRIGKTLDGAQ